MLAFLKTRKGADTNNIDLSHINQDSFQNYAKFYGNIIPTDANFDQKMNQIYLLITEKHLTDIQVIAKESDCTLPECILKIRYLKNKRLLGDIYIDSQNMILFPCSEEDEKLLDRYKPFIYGSHSQVNEIANVISNPNRLDIQSLRKEILNDLKRLDSKGLINGLKIDDIDGKIIYYTIEKKKIHNNYETVHCPNCGALNDVEINSKARCGYCQTIIIGRDYTDSI